MNRRRFLANLAAGGGALLVAPGALAALAEPAAATTTAPATYTVRARAYKSGVAYTSEPVYVTLSTATGGWSVYYTTDGDIPTANSNLYTEPFLVPTPGSVRAIAKARP